MALGTLEAHKVESCAAVLLRFLSVEIASAMRMLGRSTARCATAWLALASVFHETIAPVSISLCRSNSIGYEL